jgi:hypothetical protein
MEGEIDMVYYFDPGLSYVLSMHNLSADCPFGGPDTKREILFRAYATNDADPFTGQPLQWREVPIVVPPLDPGETLEGRWNYEIPPDSPRNPLDQRELKFDMEAQWYVAWIEWRGERISDKVAAYNNNYVP